MRAAQERWRRMEVVRSFYVQQKHEGYDTQLLLGMGILALSGQLPMQLIVNTVTSIQLKKKTALGIFKNVWAALRSYKNKKRGVLLSDGKGVGGSGRLTDPVIDRMQTAYGYAIRKNKGDPEASCKVIWAKLSISEIRYSLFRQVPV